MILKKDIKNFDLKFLENLKGKKISVLVELRTNNNNEDKVFAYINKPEQIKILVE